MSDYLTNQVLKTHRPVAIAPRLPSLFEPLPVGNAFVPLTPGTEEASPFPAASAYQSETSAQIAEMPAPDPPSSAVAIRNIPSTATAKQAAESPDSPMGSDMKERRDPAAQPRPENVPADRGKTPLQQAGVFSSGGMTHRAWEIAADEPTLPVRQNSPLSRSAPRPTDPAPVRLAERFVDPDVVTPENSPDESRQHTTHASPAPSRAINTLTHSDQAEPGRNEILSQVNQEGGPTAVANKKTPDNDLAYPPQPQAVRFTANQPGSAVSQPATQAETGTDVNPTAVTHEEINQESVTLTMQAPAVKVAAVPSSTQSPKQIASQPVARIEEDVNPVILNRVELRDNGSTYLVESQTMEEVASAPLSMHDPGQVGNALAFRVNPPVVSPSPMGADRGDRDFSTQLPVTEVAVSNAAGVPEQLTLAKQATLETDVLVQQKPAVAKTESVVRQKPILIETSSTVGQKPVVVTTSPTAVPHPPIAAPDAQKHGWPALFDQPASAAMSPTDPAPTIHVTIGRVEVRAVASPTTPSSRQRAAPTRSLDEYLRQRKGEGS